MQASGSHPKPFVYQLHFCDRSTCCGTKSCQCYYHCCSLGSATIQLLVETIPAFEFIFFGHPSMKQEKVGAATNWNMGTCRLYVHPDYGVDRQEFEILVHAVKAVMSGTMQPPALHDIMPTAVKVAEKFGGCSHLDRYFHALEGHRGFEHRVQVSPTIPAEDADQLYEWRLLGPIGSLDSGHHFSTQLDTVQEEGFEFACFGTPPQPNPTQHYVSLRRRKRSNVGGDAMEQQPQG